MAKGSPTKTKKAANATPHPKYEDIIRGKLIESLSKHFPLGNKKGPFLSSFCGLFVTNLQ